MGDDEIRGCDYHTSHWNFMLPGEVHVIALDSFDNKAELDQGKGRSGRGDKVGVCDVLAKEKVSYQNEQKYKAECKSRFFDWKQNAGEAKCNTRGVSYHWKWSLTLIPKF